MHFLNRSNHRTKLLSCLISWCFPLSPSTGKERDEETGYGYFGARYMDHELMTMWLSVDPMANKYPSLSPYAYCAWNPVKLVDPDGREIKFDPESEAMIADFEERTVVRKKSAQTERESFGDVQYPNIPGNKSRRIDAKMIHGLPVSRNTIYRYENKTYNNKK